jgi:hypothetical protein
MNCKLNLLLASSLFALITQAQVVQLQPLTTFGPNGDGSILPGQLPYLTDGSTNSYSGSSGHHELQRSMAYNPTTGHLLVLSRTNIMTGSQYYVGILDAATGADVGSLDLGIPGFGADAGYDFSLIAVADDGAIYVCDLSSKTTSSGAFNLYHWASESSSQDYVFSGDPGNFNPASNGRWGDTMSVTGSGINTKILLSSRGNLMAILTPTDPSLTAPWTSTPIQTTVPSGNIGFAQSFGASDATIWAKTVVGPLYLFNNNYTVGVGGTATNIQTYPTTVFPGWTGAIGIQLQSNLLASLEMPPGLAANVRLYDIANTANPPVLLDRKAWVTNEAGNGVFAGSVFFVGTNLYALNSDNGIMAFSLVTGAQPQLAPAVILEPSSVAAYFQNNATFTGAADGIPAPAYQWYFNTNTVISSSTSKSNSLVVTNIAPANLGPYFFIVTNSSGSATSSVAFLSQAIAFQNGQIYEPFDYPVGQQLFGLGGWVTNAAATAPNLALSFIATGNLGAPGLAAPVGNHYLWASNVTVRLPFGTITNGPLYFSFTERATNVFAPGLPKAEDPIGGLTYFSNTSLFPKVDCCWIDANDYQIGMAKGSGVANIITNQNLTFNSSSIVFIVGCFTQTNNSANNALGATIQLWVNPSPTNYGAATAPPADAMTSAGSGDIATGVDRISLRGETQGVSHEIDELRIGFTWASVTPPPPVYLSAGADGNNNVVVSWPTNAVAWNLFGTTNLSGGTWTMVSPIVVQGTNNTYTAAGPMGQEFFRLSK